MFTILALGDSIVQGREAPCTRGWVQMLKENFEPLDRFNFLFNLGIPGDTSHTLRKRIEMECQARFHHRREGDQSIILIGIGTNDAKCVGKPDVHETSPEHFRDNLHHIIGTAKTFSEQVVLVGLLPVDEALVAPYEDTWFTNERQRQYNAILHEVANFEHALFIDLFDEWSAQDYKHLLADGVHPTEAGHGMIYEKVKAEIKRFWETA